MITKFKIFENINDPYGEEDWLDESRILEWNELNVSNVKSIIFANRTLNLLNKIVSFFEKSEKDPSFKKDIILNKKILKIYNFLNRKEIKEKINSNGDIEEKIEYIKNRFNKKNPKCDFYNELNTIIKYLIQNDDVDMIKLYNLRKMIPIGRKITKEDPYGEEEWLDESKILEKFEYTDKKIPCAAILEEIKHSGSATHSEKMLNEDFKGWVMITSFPNSPTSIKAGFHITSYEINVIDLMIRIRFDNYFYDNKMKYFSNSIKFPIEEDAVIIKLDYTPPISIISSEDPYGEENWNDDEI